MMGSSDTLELLVSRILRKDWEVKYEILERDSHRILKLYKRLPPLHNSILLFSPSVFILVFEQGKETDLKVKIMTYNEETLEEHVVATRSDTVISGLLEKLNAPSRPCPGLREESLNTSCLDIAGILIERQGGAIVYRSRSCERIVGYWGSQPGCPPHPVLPEVCQTCAQICPAKLLVEIKSSPAQFSKNLDDDNLEASGLLESFSDDEDKINTLLANAQRNRNRRKEEGEEEEEGKQHAGGNVVFARPVSLSPRLTTFKTDVEAASGAEATQPDLQFNIKGNLFSCPAPNCDKTFKILMGKRMKSHLIKAHPGDLSSIRILEGNLGSRCQHCSRDFPTLEELFRHAKKCRQSATCELCGQVFVTTGSLKVHKRNVHSDDCFACSEPGCDKTVKTKQSLADHIASVHKNEKRYMCSGCGKDFRYRHQRRMCENKHNGKFIHPCRQCDKKFNDKRRYDQHMRVHTGEKPFICPICSFRCARLDNLNLHTRKAHGVTSKEAERIMGVSCKQEATMADQDHLPSGSNQANHPPEVARNPPGVPRNPLEVTRNPLEVPRDKERLLLPGSGGGGVILGGTAGRTASVTDTQLGGRPTLPDTQLGGRPTLPDNSQIFQDHHVFNVETKAD